jgi:hypothetical protein
MFSYGIVGQRCNLFSILDFSDECIHSRNEWMQNLGGTNFINCHDKPSHARRKIQQQQQLSPQLQ